MTPLSDEQRAERIKESIPEGLSTYSMELLINQFREVREEGFKEGAKEKWNDCYEAGKAEGFREGVRACMVISDGEAPNDYPSDLISGCKYHVTEKMLALIDPKIKTTLEDWEKIKAKSSGTGESQ